MLDGVNLHTAPAPSSRRLFFQRADAWENFSTRWFWLLLAIFLAGCMARGRILFGTPLMPGINGAYYLLQARAVLSRGALAVADLPLTFFIQAGVARIIQFFYKGDSDASIVLAVKLADAMLPALVVFPVFFLLRRWAGAAKSRVWIAFIAASLAVMNTPSLGMVGDFEKNSLGIVWLAVLLLRIHIWMETPSVRNAIGVVFFWGLIAVTHIGVFGASLLFGTVALLCYFLISGINRATWRALWPLLIAAALVCAIAMALVLWSFDAHRVHRLASAVMHPMEFFAGENGPVGINPSHPLPPPPPGGPGRFFLPHWLVSALFAMVSIPAIAICWQRREKIPAADASIVSACAMGILVLTGPWVNMEKAMRFNLISIVPAILAGAFVLQHMNRPRLRTTIALLAFLGLTVPSIERLAHGGSFATIDTVGIQELHSLAPLIAKPGQTLIVARHGIEWWAAWTLHTHIAHATALRPEDWRQFDAIFFLKTKKGGFPPMHGPSHGFLPPPPTGNPPGRMPNPMADPEIPSGAEIVHDGEYFTLARVAAQPSSLKPPTVTPPR